MTLQPMRMPHPAALAASPCPRRRCLPPPRLPAATLVDVVGTAALLTVSEKSGVSLNINCNYLSKAALGSSVVIDAQVQCGAVRRSTLRGCGVLAAPERWLAW